MPRFTNNQCQHQAAMKNKFCNNNETISGSWQPSGVYAVFSYGSHFPMFVWDNGAKHWFENSDKYSRTTAKQMGQVRPVYDAIPLNTERMVELVEQGYNGLVKRRLLGELRHES